MFLPLLVDAISRWKKNDTNMLTISSCTLVNTSQLDHYCTTDVQQDEEIAVTLNNLNAIETSQKLCGEYRYHQGTVSLCMQIIS